MHCCRVPQHTNRSIIVWWQLLTAICTMSQKTERVAYVSQNFAHKRVCHVLHTAQDGLATRLTRGCIFSEDAERSWMKHQQNASLFAHQRKLDLDLSSSQLFGKVATYATTKPTAARSHQVMNLESTLQSTWTFVWTASIKQHSHRGRANWATVSYSGSKRTT